MHKQLVVGIPLFPPTTGNRTEFAVITDENESVEGR
jgi:hypothetical protein